MDLTLSTPTLVRIPNAVVLTSQEPALTHEQPARLWPDPAADPTGARYQGWLDDQVLDHDRYLTVVTYCGRVTDVLAAARQVVIAGRFPVEVPFGTPWPAVGDTVRMVTAADAFSPHFTTRLVEVRQGR